MSVESTAAKQRQLRHTEDSSGLFIVSATTFLAFKKHLNFKKKRRGNSSLESKNAVDITPGVGLLLSQVAEHHKWLVSCASEFKCICAVDRKLPLILMQHCQFPMKWLMLLKFNGRNGFEALDSYRLRFRFKLKHLFEKRCFCHSENNSAEQGEFSDLFGWKPWPKYKINPFSSSTVILLFIFFFSN